MPTLIHLSDLHFGPAHVAHLGDLILQDIETLNPDAVVISGDFTMRAKTAEYEQARAFVQNIRKPTLAIPGNHDQPWFPVSERLRQPFARYARYIHPTIDSTLSLDGLFILGLNDNRPILPGGFWSREQRAWMEREWGNGLPDAVKILATHHQVHWGGRIRPFGFWYPSRALQFLARGGIEIVLNGHTHVPSAVQSSEGIVIARGGTATSTRTRHGNRNAYNLIAIDARAIVVTVREYVEGAGEFVNGREWPFARKAR